MTHDSASLNTGLSWVVGGVMLATAVSELVSGFTGSFVQPVLVRTLPDTDKRKVSMIPMLRSLIVATIIIVMTILLFYVTGNSWHELVTSHAPARPSKTKVAAIS
jgi:hypothetical protein